MQATLLPPNHGVFCAPITANRDLADCLIANVRMIDLLKNDLISAGFQMVEPEKASTRTIRIPIDTWLELASILLLGRNEKSARLCDSEGVVLAWKGEDAPEDCEEEIRTEAGCFPIVHPWDLLKMNEEIVDLLDESTIAGTVSPLASISGNVKIGAGAEILPGTVIQGPVIIGPNAKIGPNALICGATSIGADCYIGHGAEVKNSIVYPNTYISRHCFVGDSIIGSNVMLGAGTRTENHCFDGGNVFSNIRSESIDSGRKNLGAFIADGVRTGVNTSLDAGVKIGLDEVIRPGTYVETDLL